MNRVVTGFFIGLSGGIFGGLLGVGGGVITIPLMVGLLKIGQLKAHGTSLVALVFIGIAGAITYSREGSVDLTASLLLALTAVFTAHAGARFANVLPEWKLKHAFGAFLISVSVLLVLKSYLSHLSVSFTGWTKIIVLLLTGLFTGFLSGMMGVGGGAIMIPVMVLLVGFSQHTAQGSSLLVMIPAGIAGAATHWRLGNVEGNILVSLVPGILLGTYAGGSLAHLLPEGYLRLTFAVVLAWTGIRYLKASASDGKSANNQEK
jgi:uncharacterized membrane protein YfcA